MIRRRFLLIWRYDSVELVNRCRPTDCGLRDFNRDARYAGAQFRQSYQPPGKPRHHRIAIYRIVWPRRDSLGTIYRRLMKCLVLRLRAVARSVFTVAIPLINWLNLARRDRYTGCIKRDVYAGKREKFLEESRVFRSEYFILQYRFARAIPHGWTPCPKVVIRAITITNEDSVVFVWTPIIIRVFRCYTLYQFKRYQLRRDFHPKRNQWRRAYGWSLLIQPVQLSSE